MTVVSEQRLKGEIKREAESKRVERIVKSVKATVLSLAVNSDPTGRCNRIEC